MELQVEASGETVGEAKWSALRELERRRPGLDKSAVRFQVVSEGERGLLGVGYTPARVIATLSGAAEPRATPDESNLAGFRWREWCVVSSLFTCDDFFIFIVPAF